MLVIDATDLLVGRMATQVARAALHGKEVRIINCDKAVVSGHKQAIVSSWKTKYARGVPKKGPFYRRQPDRLVRRMIRGMLPYKTPRGRDAFKRVLTYIGAPEEFKNAQTIKGAHLDKLPNIRYLTMGQICKELGGDWHGN
ncbi:50S ribosomal protein L13 [Candidatus Woesearchaeota archaeon]|nr:50S ribosomal protein L13 [Candidatus Woesearchaeota archaeon]